MRQLKRYGALTAALVALLVWFPFGRYSLLGAAATSKPIKFSEVDLNGRSVAIKGASFRLTNSQVGKSVLDERGAAQSSLVVETNSAASFVAIPAQQPGAYNLTETKAPHNYAQLVAPIVIKVSDTGAVSAQLENVALEEGELSGSDAVRYAHNFTIERQGTGASDADGVSGIFANIGSGFLPTLAGVGTLLLAAISVGVFAAAILLFRLRRHRQKVRIANRQLKTS